MVSSQNEKDFYFCYSLERNNLVPLSTWYLVRGYSKIEEFIFKNQKILYNAPVNYLAVGHLYVLIL